MIQVVPKESCVLFTIMQLGKQKQKRVACIMTMCVFDPQKFPGLSHASLPILLLKPSLQLFQPDSIANNMYNITTTQERASGLGKYTVQQLRHRMNVCLSNRPCTTWKNMSTPLNTTTVCRTCILVFVQGKTLSGT